MTSKQKIDNLLGIKDDQSVDQYLDSLSLDSSRLSSVSENIADSVREGLQTIDSNLSAIASGSSDLTMKDIDSSMKEVEELISMSKKMFKHVYESIVSTDLVDSELIGSAAKLLESIHINIQEFLTIYKDKQKFIDKIKIMIFQQEQKKELMRLQHNLQLDRMNHNLDSNSVDADGTYVFDTDKFIRELDNKEKEVSK